MEKNLQEKRKSLSRSQRKELMVKAVTGLTLQTISGIAAGYFLFKGSSLTCIGFMGYALGMYIAAGAVIKLICNNNEEPWECSLTHERPDPESKSPERRNNG